MFQNIRWLGNHKFIGQMGHFKGSHPKHLASLGDFLTKAKEKWKWRWHFKPKGVWSNGLRVICSICSFILTVNLLEKK